ncbi:MAG: YlbF family regulator [Oscillospiraceae bacterium]|nr:YlbF family regulator [Oscillospiraceae bacterium]
MEIITLTRELGKKIQESEEYAELTQAKAANDLDDGLQELIGEYNLKRIALEQGDVDEDRLPQAESEAQEIFGRIMTNQNMIAYNTAKNKMNALVSQINTILVMSVNGADPETCDVSNAGGCGSGGGCSGCGRH